LFDTTVVSLCDATVFVTADEMIRKRRLLQRGYSADTASKMIARQEYMLASAQTASLVIENNDEFGSVIEQLESFLSQVTR
jgi:dephospho-CoA kinase